jgi:hypothetical protein
MVITQINKYKIPKYHLLHFDACKYYGNKWYFILVKLGYMNTK